MSAPGVGVRLGLGLLVLHQVPTLRQSGQSEVTDGNKKHHEEPQGRAVSPSGWRMSRCPDTRVSGLRCPCLVPGHVTLEKWVLGSQFQFLPGPGPGNPRSPVQLEEERAAVELGRAASTVGTGLPRRSRGRPG